MHGWVCRFVAAHGVAPVVVTESAGGGGYLSTYALRLTAKSIVHIASGHDLDTVTNVLAALRSGKRKNEFLARRRNNC